MNRKTVVLSLSAIGLTISFTGVISGTTAWYAYATRVSLSYGGTSVSNTEQLQIGLKIDEENFSSQADLDSFILGLEEKGRTHEKLNGKDYVFRKPGSPLSSNILSYYLSGQGYASNSLYPVTTKDFDWDSENAKLLFTMTAQYGTPNFQNFVNSDLNPSDVRSMCCRLQLDKRELRRRGGGLFGADEFTGSIGVVTINLPQIGYLANSENEFFTRLDYLMDLAKESLCAKRKVIQRLYDGGLFPYTRRYLKTLNNHFNTIGLCGMNECCLNFLGVNIADPKGKAFAERVLQHMRERMQDYQEQTGDLFNLEATPAESTSYRLARHDKEQFPDIITSGVEDPYYTNSSQLPVDYTADVFEALDHQESLQTKYTGGTMFHVFMGESIKDWKSCGELIKNISHNYRIPFFTISPTYSICHIHGYLSGQQFECPKCKAERELELKKRLAELEEEKRILQAKKA